MAGSSDVYEANQLTVDGDGEATERETAAERRRRLMVQVGLATLAGMGNFTMGASQPWPSPALASLARNNQTLVGTEISLTTSQQDMTGSLLYMGSMFGSWGSGWIMGVIGRRRTLQANAAPFLLGWLMVALAPHPPLMLAGRFVLGLAVGSVMVSCMTYVLEVSDTAVRGSMSLIPNLGTVLGGQYTFWLGTLLPWHYLAFACSVPVLFILMGSLLLPESPSYLVVCGHRLEAVRILRRLRGPHADVETEIQQLEWRNRVEAGGRGLKMRDVAGVWRRVAVVLVLFFLQQLCGNVVLKVQTTRVLEAAGTPLDPSVASGIIVLTRVAGVGVSFFLWDTVGRRLCLVGSHALNAGALITLGTFTHMREHSESHDSYAWLPMVCLAISLFAGDIGIDPIPYILSVEYFPTKIRTQVSSVCITWGTILAMVALQLYSPMVEAMGHAGLFWVYGSTSVVATVFSLIAVTETKSKPVG